MTENWIKSKRFTLAQAFFAIMFFGLVGCDALDGSAEFFIDECVTFPAMKSAYGHFLQDPVNGVSEGELEADLTIHAYKIETRQLDDSERQRALSSGRLPWRDTESLRGEFRAASQGGHKTTIDWRRVEKESASSSYYYIQPYPQGHRLYKSGLWVGYENNAGVLTRLISFNRFYETAENEYTHIELQLNRVGAMKRIGCIFPTS